jgi:hypothetical protein
VRRKLKHRGKATSDLYRIAAVKGLAASGLAAIERSEVRVSMFLAFP